MRRKTEKKELEIGVSVIGKRAQFENKNAKRLARSGEAVTE